MVNIFLITAFLSETLYIGMIHLLSDSLNKKGASPITKITQIPGDISFTFHTPCKKRSLCRDPRDFTLQLTM